MRTAHGRLSYKDSAFYTPDIELHSNIVDRKDKEDKGEKVLYTNATSYDFANFAEHLEAESHRDSSGGVSKKPSNKSHPYSVFHVPQSQFAVGLGE
ncbi:MAG: hypothetical protein Fur006_02390 [Coleofasciculaceae cyanobacterium]